MSVYIQSEAFQLGRIRCVFVFDKDDWELRLDSSCSLCLILLCSTESRLAGDPFSLFQTAAMFSPAVAGKHPEDEAAGGGGEAAAAAASLWAEVTHGGQLASFVSHFIKKYRIQFYPLNLYDTWSDERNWTNVMPIHICYFKFQIKFTWNHFGNIDLCFVFFIEPRDWGQNSGYAWYARR